MMIALLLYYTRLIVSCQRKIARLGNRAPKRISGAPGTTIDSLALARRAPF